MKLLMDRRFKNRIRGRIERYEFQVGVLEDKVHHEPVDSIKSYAGGPARGVGRGGGTTTSEVSKRVRTNLGFNYLTKPFQERNTELARFTAAFLKTAFRGTDIKRVVNLLQAVVRNPILRGDYGNNSPATARAKGFNRLMIDTAQLFKSIKAKVTVRRA